MQEERRTSQSETNLGEVWRVALSLFAFWAELAMCQRCSRRIAEKDGDDEKMDAARSSSEREADGRRRFPQRWRQPKGEDRTGMKKEATLLRCTLLDGSAWSTEKKYMRRYKGKCDIFLGIEHRLRKEDMEEHSFQQRGQGRMEICGGCSKNH